jgi:hypothetical protein
VIVPLMDYAVAGSARWAAGRTPQPSLRFQPGKRSAFSLCVRRFLGDDALVLRSGRSIGVAIVTMIAAVAIGLGMSVSSAAPASASTTSAVTDIHPPVPGPLFGFLNPLAAGYHVIDAIAQGLANIVEMVSTPPPIAIPAPHAGATTDGS